MKNHNLNRFASLPLLLVLMTGTALAATETGGTSESMGTDAQHPGDGRSAYMPEVGIFFGGATQQGDQFKTDPSYQIEAGVTPVAPFSVALQAGVTPSSIDVPGGKVNFNTTDVLLKGAVSLGMPGSFMSNIFLGGKSGVAIYSGDAPTKTNFAVGGTAGFDIPLSSSHKATLGAEGTYLGVLGGDDNNLTPDQVSVLGAVKYWF